jgi:hypothetical protein
MSGSVKWGASPLSSAVNWLSKEVFGQRQKASQTAAVPPPLPTPPGANYAPLLLLLLEDA